MQELFTKPDNETAALAGTLDEQAYQQVRTALVEGVFAPGDRLSIRRVATALGVSPMPVRTALRRLAAEQALDLTAAGSAIVPRLTRSAFAELGAIRAELEPLALRMAVPNLTAATLDALEFQLDQHNQAREKANPEAVLRADRQFLFITYQASAAPMLLQFIESLWLRRGPVFWEARWSLLSHGGVRHHHREILQALRRGATDEAVQALRQEITGATAFLLQHLQFTDTPKFRTGLSTLLPMKQQ
jgi:GntR family colanic acid and biofilm gene transcriptional regulator